MSIYDDLKAAAGSGLQRTALDFYDRAQQKFIERLANRKPKTLLEKNVGEAFLDTPTGRATADEYRRAQINKYLRDPFVWLIAGFLILVISLNFRR